MWQASLQVSAKTAAPLEFVCNLFWRYSVAWDQAQLLQPQEARAAFMNVSMHGASKQTNLIPLQSGGSARLWKPDMHENVVAFVRQLPAAAFCHWCTLGGRDALGALFAADPVAPYLCVLSTCGTPHTAGLAPDISFLALMCLKPPVKPRLEPSLMPCHRVTACYQSVPCSHIAGLAPGVKFVGFDVFDRAGDAYFGTIVEGINWAVANKAKYNITVINMSLGAPLAAGE